MKKGILQVTLMGFLAAFLATGCSPVVFTSTNSKQKAKVTDDLLEDEDPNNGDDTENDTQNPGDTNDDLSDNDPSDNNDNNPTDHDDKDDEDEYFPPHRDSKKVEIASAAFEDLVTQSDSDYNDFVTNFKIRESYENNKLNKIRIVFTPRGRSAGLDHSFLLVLDGKPDNQNSLGYAETAPIVQGDASVKVEYFYADGTPTGEVYTQDSIEKDLTIFASTKQVLGGQNKVNEKACEVNRAPEKIAKVTVIPKNPQQNTKKCGCVDLSRYRMMLHVKDGKNTQIDLFEVNPQSLAPNGYPLGLIVSSDWRYPEDTINMFGLYPYLIDYVDEVKDQQNSQGYVDWDDIYNWDWFDYPVDSFPACSI